MNREDFAEFGGSLTADVLEFHPDAIPEPNTLRIRMTRGERRIAEELRKTFGGFERVIIDVDGEQHEFPADILIRLLEGYEDVHRVNRHMALFGTPERAARTEYALEMCRVVGCEDCPARGISRVCSDFAYSEGALLEWLRGDA